MYRVKRTLLSVFMLLTVFYLDAINCPQFAMYPYMPSLVAGVSGAQPLSLSEGGQFFSSMFANPVAPFVCSDAVFLPGDTSLVRVAAFCVCMFCCCCCFLSIFERKASKERTNIRQKNVFFSTSMWDHFKLMGISFSYSFSYTAVLHPVGKEKYTKSTDQARDDVLFCTLSTSGMPYTYATCTGLM